MREASAVGIALVKAFEGFSSAIYVCPAGWETIGFGHVVKPAERERFVAGIDEAEAEALLDRDVDAAERAVARLCPVELADGQFDALVSFTFNLGAGALQASTLRRRVDRQDPEAHEEFHRWVFAGGRRLPVLVRRRAAEAALYRSECP